MAPLLFLALQLGFAVSDAATDPLLVGRAPPLNLTPFPEREMNFLARFSDVAVKAKGAAEHPVTTIPPRDPTARTGSRFLQDTETFTKAEREDAIYDEVRRGNVPSFLRTLKPVRLATGAASGNRHAGIVWVMPDYVAIGSDEDFVRIPMDLQTAMRLASDLRLALPTRKMVDAIYEQADVKLTPRPMRFGPEMESNEYYWNHNKMIEESLKPKLKSRHALVAGHKKDVVIGLRLWLQPERLMIYGWHMRDGNPIQPLSDAHLVTYADYSHGVRFVSPTAELDGRPVDLATVVAAETLEPVFGYVPIPWYRERMVMPPWEARK